MFNNLSMGGTGMVVFIITLGLNYFNIIPADNQVASFVEATMTAIGFVMWVWGQMRRKDLMMGILRK